MITAKDISIGYGQKVIREGISFDAPQGECILLCGANGTGKSTLLRTIAGLIPIPGSKGSTATGHGLIVKGSTVMVPTHIPKIKGFTVKDFVRTGMYTESGWAWRLNPSGEAKLKESLVLLGLDAIASDDISRISDGQFQKACIAAALVRRPGNILLDEPTAFLDPDGRQMVLETLRRLTRETGATVIFSTHDIHDALAYVDEIFTLSPYMKLFETFSGKVSYL